MRLNSLVAAAAVLAAAATVAVSGTSGASISGKTVVRQADVAKSDSQFTILFLSDTSGSLKVFGSAYLQSARAAVSFVNQHGGFDGSDGVIDAVDTGGVAATAVSSLLKYVSDNPKPNLVWAGTESTEGVALIPFMAKYHLLSTQATDAGACATDSQQKCPAFFNGGVPQTTQDASIAHFMKGKDYSNVGILEENFAYAETETPIVSSQLTKLGIKHEVASFSATATSVTPELEALQSEGAKAVYVEAVGAQAAYALSDRATIGWSAPLVFGTAASSTDLTKLAPSSDFTNTYAQTFSTSVPSLAPPGAKTFLKELKSYGGVPAGDELGTNAIGWDGIIAVALAADDAKSTSPTAIISQLEKKTIKSPWLALNSGFHITASDHENSANTIASVPVIPLTPIDQNGQFSSAG